MNTRGRGYNATSRNVLQLSMYKKHPTSQQNESTLLNSRGNNCVTLFCSPNIEHTSFHSSSFQMEFVLPFDLGMV
eukprot:m.190368 g.190368  ORF g.190368 m.190368 type:complete len:75 (-) comp14816_c0_seq2:589-813(-)